MWNQLKEEVLTANLMLVEKKLVIETWGNVSGVDREAGIAAIKPSGVPYEQMKKEDIVIVKLSDGTILEGELRPSSDLPTHLELYRAFPNIGGVVHTHSRWATIFAQAGQPIPALGTTHCDYFYGGIPCTRVLTQEEIAGEYERATGLVIAETFGKGVEEEIPAILVRGHGPFAWGKSPQEAVYHAEILEEVAMMAWHSIVLSKGRPEEVSQALLDRHFLRKHGPEAYYGQSESR